MDTGKFNIAGVIERMLWTFIQAAIASISVVGATTAVTGGNVSALRTIGLTALGAGIAAVLSLAKNITGESLVVQSVKRQQAVSGQGHDDTDMNPKEFDQAVRNAVPANVTNAWWGVTSPTAPWVWSTSTSTPAPVLTVQTNTGSSTDSTYASSITPEAPPAKRATKKAAAK